MKLIPKLIPTTILAFVIISLVTIITTKISGPFPTYPATDFHSISWQEVKLEIPRILITSFFGSIVFYFGLYWDWLKKEKQNSDTE